MNGLFSALAILAFLIALDNCAGGGSGGVPGRVNVPLPPFDQYTTDLPAGEGTILHPLEVANPVCVLQPIWGGQTDMCAGNFATVWADTNYRATTSDWNRWRYVVNDEPSWAQGNVPNAFNTGPPDQSLPLDQPPIIFQPGTDTVKYGFEIANEAAFGGRIPYVAAAYLRGVQGDPQPNVAPWGRAPELSFTATYDKTTGPTLAQSNYVWVYFRDPVKGTRYMAHGYLWNSGWLDGMTPISFNWNWPAVHSYYYPGADLHIGLYTDCPGAITRLESGPQVRWTVDAEALLACRYPEAPAVKPDFLGFEIAVEGTYLDFAHPTGTANRMAVTLTGVRLDLKP